MHTPLVSGCMAESGITSVMSGNGEHAPATNYNRKTLDLVHCTDKLLPVVSQLFHCCHYNL